MNEGLEVVSLLEQLKRDRVSPNLYIITPFLIIAGNLRSLIRESAVLNFLVDKPGDWLEEHIGTVHTVQGREAEAVFFVLGGPLTIHRGARGWAGGKPNLVNVAVTRAKEVMYVIGNRHLWKDAGVFRELSDRLPVTHLKDVLPTTNKPDKHSAASY